VYAGSAAGNVSCDRDGKIFRYRQMAVLLRRVKGQGKNLSFNVMQLMSDYKFVLHFLI
jgi:hypothetical protein